MKTKLLESYKKGWNAVNKACGFETVMVLEEKVFEFNGYKFRAVPGMAILDIPDDILAKWLYMSKKVSECKEVTGEDLIKIITDLGRE